MLVLLCCGIIRFGVRLVVCGWVGLVCVCFIGYCGWRCVVVGGSVLVVGWCRWLFGVWYWWKFSCCYSF